MRSAPLVVLRERLDVETAGEGFVDLTSLIVRWLRESSVRDGLLTVFVRHTSASLTIQENTDPDVRHDLIMALRALAPEGTHYRHDLEGADDMPAHIRSMLTATSLTIPVGDAILLLGTWQAVYLIEHRRAQHRREVVLMFQGAVEPG
jgi:secondary thiamine-phosphate synthase enzyme